MSILCEYNTPRVYVPNGKGIFQKLLEFIWNTYHCLYRAACSVRNACAAVTHELFGDRSVQECHYILEYTGNFDTTRLGVTSLNKNVFSRCNRPSDDPGKQVHSLRLVCVCWFVLSGTEGLCVCIILQVWMWAFLGMTWQAFYVQLFAVCMLAVLCIIKGSCCFSGSSRELLQC